jgi:hypothetical protein
MAVVDDINKVITGVDRISKDGVPININHELDTPSVSYLALMALLVVVAAVVLAGLKDIVVNRIIRS